MTKKILVVEDEFVVANDLSNILSRASFEVVGIANSVQDALQIIEGKEIDMVLLDIHLKGKQTGIDLAKKLKDQYIPFIYISANSNKSILDEAKLTRPYGFLVKPFREKDVLTALEIAFYHHTHNQEYQLRQSSLFSKVVNDIYLAPHEPNIILERLSAALQANLPFDFLEIMIRGNNMGGPAFFRGLLRIGFKEYQEIGVKELSTILGIPTAQLHKKIVSSKSEGLPMIFSDDQFKRTLEEKHEKGYLVNMFHLRSQLFFPLRLSDGTLASLSFYSRQPNMYENVHLDFLIHSKHQFEEVLQKLKIDAAEVTRIQGIPVKGNENFPQDKGTEFPKMIGKSPLLIKVFDYIKRVAPMDTSVLIIGDSGTGKELVAKYIHQCSSRSDKPLTIINCATLPENLIESILFGHEKGSFTGATEKKIGKFEQAHGGTIFLDEIGEMPRDMQVKLLRVLQEKEIERIGGTHSIKVDVRIIAATNRNLETEVENGNFRLDLYYRLNVFPIKLPTLKDRQEDIIALTQYFLNKFGHPKFDALTISEDVMKQILSYSWPGNIRELEHYIERSVVLCNTNVITETYFPVGKVPELIEEKNSMDNKPKALFDMEREYIISILKNCKGKIFGAGGAAEVLKLPPSTLNSKIRKLGISKREIYN